MTTFEAAPGEAEVNTSRRSGGGRGGKRGGSREGAVAQRNRLFSAARRHTWLVKALRVLFPVGVVGCFAFYGLILKSSFAIGNANLRPGKVEVTADDLKMKNPSYFGITSDKGKYEVRAKEAVVNLAMTGPVRLESIDGDLTQLDGAKTFLKATRGILDQKKNELELFDGVDVHTTGGMKAKTQRALVHTKDNRIETKAPIAATMPSGTLTAATMDFATKEKIGKFRGNVILRLVQAPPQPGARPSSGPSIGLAGGDGRQPVDIQSHSLDIDDNKSIADFKGQVVATQGDTMLKAPELHVTYEGQAARQPGLGGGAAPTSAQAGGDSPASQVSKLNARTGVTLTAGTDRRIVADIVDFDVKADTALFQGNVELMQAKSTFRGGRLAVDRKSGRSRLDTPTAASSTPVGRIAATLIQQAADPTKTQATAKAKAAPASTDLGATLRSDPNAPTDIEADMLDVNETAKTAVFRGRVVAKQGDYIITAAEMVAHYAGQSGLLASGAEPQKPGAPGSAAGGASGGAQLTHIETSGGTRIVSKDGREAEGQNANFDVKSNKVVLSGPAGVTLRQQNNEIKGSKLRMDLTSGEANVENSIAPGTATVQAPTPAQLSIAAKPGVAPPAQPTACPPGGGQMCAIIYPDQMKQAVETKGQSIGQNGLPIVVQKNKPAAAPAQIGASPVYKGN